VGILKTQTQISNTKINRTHIDKYFKTLYNISNNGVNHAITF